MTCNAWLLPLLQIINNNLMWLCGPLVYDSNYATKHEKESGDWRSDLRTTGHIKFS